MTATVLERARAVEAEAAAVLREHAFTNLAAVAWAEEDFDRRWQMATDTVDEYWADAWGQGRERWIGYNAMSAGEGLDEVYGGVFVRPMVEVLNDDCTATMRRCRICRPLLYAGSPLDLNETRSTHP